MVHPCGKVDLKTVLILGEFLPDPKGVDQDIIQAVYSESMGNAIAISQKWDIDSHEDLGQNTTFFSDDMTEKSEILKTRSNILCPILRTERSRAHWRGYAAENAAR